MAGLDDLIEAAGWAVGDPDPGPPPGRHLTPIADLPARGARWRLSPDGRWDRWSWLGNQWEPAAAPSPPPPAASPSTGEREWVQHPDGRWEDVALEWDPAVAATPDDEWLTGTPPLGEPDGERDPVAGFWPAPPDHADDPTTSDGWWAPEIDDEAETGPGAAADEGARVDAVVTPPAWFDADPDLLTLEWAEPADDTAAEDTDASPAAHPLDGAAAATDLSLDEWLAPPEMPGGNGAVVSDEVADDSGPATPGASDDGPEPPPVVAAAPVFDGDAEPGWHSSALDAPEAIGLTGTGPARDGDAEPDSHPPEAIGPTAAGPASDDHSEPDSRPPVPEATSPTGTGPARDDDAEPDSRPPAAEAIGPTAAGPAPDDPSAPGQSHEVAPPAPEAITLTAAGPAPDDDAEPDPPEDRGTTAGPVPGGHAEPGPSHGSAPAAARRSVTAATLDLLPDVAPLVPAPTSASRRRGPQARPGVLSTLITPVVLTYAAYGAVWLLAAAVRAARDAWEVPWLFKGARTVPAFDGQVAIALAGAGVLVGIAIVLLRRLAPDAPAGGPRLRV